MEESRSTSVLIVDPQEIVRLGVRAALEPLGSPAVAEAATLAEALERDAHPDLIVTELLLPDAVGVEVVDALAAGFPPASILVFTTRESPADIAQAVRGGALGYVPKSAGVEELVRAARAVLDACDYIEPSLGAALARWRAGIVRSPPPLPITLSPRELSVLRLLALGHTNREIAAILGLAARTVEKYRASVFHKLNLTSRADATRHALRENLISSENL